MVESMTKIDSIGSALALVTSILKGSRILERWDGVSILIEHEHGAEGNKDIKSKETYLVMFKRQYYRAFKSHFPNCTKADGKPYGWAQIMNKELLERACRRNINWVAFVTPDGAVYKTLPMQFKRFSEAYKTETPHLKGEVAMPLPFFRRL